MKKMLLSASILALLLVSAKPISLIRLTLINKSGMEIAVQLTSVTQHAINQAITRETRFYYLPVTEGSKELPSLKLYTIEENTYIMQVFYIETYDPVYGFQCVQPPPNLLQAARNLRVVIGECGLRPLNGGEPSMRKYVPVPLSRTSNTTFGKKNCGSSSPITTTPNIRFIKRYWITRFIN